MTIKLVSYNVHGCVGTDGRRDVHRIARVIASCDADLVGLQEVTSARAPDCARADLETLAHETSMIPISGPLWQREDTAFGNAILTRLPVRAVRRIDLSIVRREPRGALDVDLAVNGALVRVLATHLGLSPGERRRQVGRLLAAASQSQDRTTIILGDLNEWFIWGRPLRWLHLGFGRCNAVPTWPSRRPLFALDRVWVRPPGAVRDVQAIVDGEARVASDHLPVSAVVSVAAEERQAAE